MMPDRSGPGGDQVKVGLSVALLAMMAGGPAAAQSGSDGTGVVHGFSVTDGDTVKFGGQTVRLFGIDAPEKAQSCDDGRWYPGPLATRALIDIIAGRPVSCRWVNYGKSGLPEALCVAGEDDLGALMVSAGWAWAFTRDSDQYVDAERRAARRGVGVHAHRCAPPWEWRTRQGIGWGR